MTSYSLTADSRRWWWLPATAGAISTAAVTAILVVPATGDVAPFEAPPATHGSSGTSGSRTVVERPCYLARRDWNTVHGWEHPVCTTTLRGPADADARGLGRPAPGYLP